MGGARRRRRYLLIGACTGAVATVAYSRLYLDAHWLSDVVGGLTAGLAYLLVAIWAVRSAPLLARTLRRAAVTAAVTPPPPTGTTG
jgi:undecaprenyl-diphosphatase